MVELFTSLGHREPEKELYNFNRHRFDETYLKGLYPGSTISFCHFSDRETAMKTLGGRILWKWKPVMIRLRIEWL